MPPSSAAPTTLLAPGVPAPPFRLPCAPQEHLSLQDLRGSLVIFAFYPADWSPVCGEEMVLFNAALEEFERFSARMLGISVDGPWCHQAYAWEHGLRFPLLADFEPKGAVARAYGAYRDADGTAQRALFVIDGDGVIQWSDLSPIDVRPGADGVLQALEAITPAERSP